MLDPTKTVRELALQIPHATRVFEQARIDYCCGGDHRLSEACQTAGVELEELELMLEENAVKDATHPINFQSLTLADLIAHVLDTHHIFTRNEIARLETLITKVVAAHGVNHPELITVSTLLRRLFDDLTQHMFKEERILFPFVIQLEQSVLQQTAEPFAPFGTVNNPIARMIIEHDNAGEILRELRQLTRNYTLPADACFSYQTLYQSLEALERDLHQHIHLENNILFPRAIAMEAGLRGRRSTISGN